MDSKKSQDIDQLNKYLKGELSAVEAYGKCIRDVENPTVVSQLKVLQASHERRVELLSARIVSLGGIPVVESGGVGKFAGIVQRGAAVFGDKASISTLEEGEDFGLKLYQDGMEHLSEAERSFVKDDLLPEQRRSHDILHEIEMKL